MRRICPTRFLVFCVAFFSTLPPEISCLGANPNHRLKCLSVANFSPTLLPTSIVTICDSETPSPSTRVKSTPLTGKSPTRSRCDDRPPQPLPPLLRPHRTEPVLHLSIHTPKQKSARAVHSQNVRSLTIPGYSFLVVCEEILPTFWLLDYAKPCHYGTIPWVASVFSRVVAQLLLSRKVTFLSISAALV